MSSFLRLLPLVCLMCSGCDFGPYLRWDLRPPAPIVQGRVAIKYVPNLRPAGRGANELNNIGNDRNGFGIPFPIVLREPNQPLDQTVARIVSEAMSSAGIGVAGHPMDPYATAQMSIEINQFWCDGYFPVFKAEVDLGLILLDPRSQTVRIRIPLHRSSEQGNCQNAYRDVMNGIYQDVAMAFMQPQIRAAVVGTAPAPVR